VTYTVLGGVLNSTQSNQCNEGSRECIDFGTSCESELISMNRNQY